jgi:hypothetical protein
MYQRTASYPEHCHRLLAANPEFGSSLDCIEYRHIRSYLYAGGMSCQ